MTVTEVFFDKQNEVIDAISYIKCIKHTTATFEKISTYLKKKDGETDYTTLKFNIEKMVHETY